MSEIALPGAPNPDEIRETDYQDFWGFSETHRFMLPDNRQWIEYKTLTEGDRQKFQKLIKKDIIMNRRDDTARVDASAGEDRPALLHVACSNWYMMRAGEPVPFTNDNKGGTFQQWLQAANPRIVEDLEKAIRLANPWLLGDMKPEDIRREITNLEEMLKIADEREAGNDSSSSR